MIASTGSSDNNRLFCTKERSESIGLDNFGFRYFDWDIGRFIQRDPSGYPDGLNNYLYCSNNPINRIDPLGLQAINWQTPYPDLMPQLPQTGQQMAAEAHQAVAAHEERKAELTGTYKTHREAGKNKAEAAATTAGITAARVTGIPQLMEAAAGVKFSGKEMGLGERITTGVDGAVNLASTAIGLKATGVGLKGAASEKTAINLTTQLAEEKGGPQLMDASKIRYTQDSISPNFKDGRPVSKLTEQLKSGEVKPEEVSPIRVFEKDGKTYSLDNRRLNAAKEAKTEVNTTQATAEDISKRQKTTTDDGQSIKIRKGKEKKND